MPSLNDFFNAVTQVNSTLQQVDNDLNTKLQQVDNDLNSRLQQIDTDVNTGFHDTINVLNHVVQLQIYADHALFHIAAQNDTIICALEHISRNTCDLVDQAHRQTELQTAMEHEMRSLLGLYRASHGDAAVAQDRLDALQAEIEKCCPPPKPDPACTYEPCPAPHPLLDLKDQGPQ